MSMKKIASVTTSVLTVLSMSGVAALAPMASAATIVDGDVIKTADHYDVYIVKLVGSKKFKRLVLNPQVFESYGHLKWENIKTVTQAEMDSYTTSELVRADGDTKVYKLTPDGDTGTKKWIETAEEFVAAGYDWDAIYTINSVDLGNYNDGGTTTPSTGFSVALASDSPAAATLPLGAKHVTVAKLTFTGTATINTITVTRGGAGEANDFANVYLYDGDNRLTNGRTVNTSSNQSTFTSLALAVSGSKTISVVVDIDATNANAGNQNYFGIAAAADVSATVSLSGTFPVNGNVMTFAGANAGTITIAKTGAISNPYVGAAQASITSFTLGAATENMVLKTITLYNGGNLQGSSITNLNLKISGTIVATGTGFDSNGRGLLTFTGTGYSLAKGTTVTATLYADLGGRPDDTIKLYVENDVDVFAIGQTYGYGVQVTRSSFDTVTTDTHNLTLQGGQLTIAFNGPSATTVGTDTNDTVLLDFSLTAASEIEVRQLRFYICYIDTVAATMELAEDEIEDIKVSEVGGTTLMGPVDGSSWTSSEDPSVCAATYTGGETYYTYTDSFTMTAGQTKHLQLTADLKSVDDLDATDIIAGLLYNPTSLSNSVKYTSSNTYLSSGDVVPSGNVMGNQQTLAASSIAVALGTDPTGVKTYVKGTTKQPALQLLFTAGQASDMTLSTVSLTAYAADGAESGTAYTGITKGKDNSNTTYPLYAKDIVSNVYLYDGDTLVSGPKGFSSADSNAVFEDVNFTDLSVNVPAGTTKALTVKVDLSNTAVSSTYDFVSFDILDGDTDIVATDNKSTTRNAAGNDDINGSTSPTVYIRKADGGTLTVATSDSYRPLSQAYYMGQANAEVSKFRFTSTTEAFTVNTLTLELPVDEVNDRVNFDNLVVSYPNSAGSTETKSGFFGSTASVTFSGLNFYVPADSYAYLTVYANLKSYASGASITYDNSFQIGVDGDGSSTSVFKATGSGGTVIGPDHSGITNQDGNNMYLYRSYPKIELVSPTQSSSSTTMPSSGLLKFKITNMGNYDLYLGGDESSAASALVKFEVVASGQDTADGVFKLYDDSTGDLISSATVTNIGDAANSGEHASASFYFEEKDVILAAGQSKTFRVDMTTGQTYFNENGDYLQIVLRDDAGNFRWYDYSGQSGYPVNDATGYWTSVASVTGLGIPIENTGTWSIAGL